MSQRISYSDFLKEGALSVAQVAQPPEAPESPRAFRIEPGEVATENELRHFWKKLRYFFRTGEKPEGNNGIMVPALIAPYLRSPEWDTEYPYYLSPGNESGEPLEIMLTELLAKTFKAEEAKILRKNLPRLMKYFREAVSHSGCACNFGETSSAVIERMKGLEVHDEEGERFRNDLGRFAEAMPEDGELIDFSHEVPLYIIRQNLQRIELLRSAYKQAMRKRAEELRELLKLDEEKEGARADAGQGFEFADGLIALDKVKSMLPRQGSSFMSTERAARIRGLITILDGTLSSQENRAHLVVNEELKDGFQWDRIFASSKLSFLPLADLFRRVEDIFDANIGSFTRVIVAMRKAELELEGKYDAEVHDEYFNHFKWFKLDPEELALFPPVILATGGFHLLRDGMAHFSNLLVSNKPIKVLAITDRTTNEVIPGVDWEDASHGFRQELAALALSHRGAHTLQCATDKPALLRSGIAEAINTTSPALIHLLVPAPSNDAHISFLKINAAASARFFPFLAYDCRQGSEWGSRFNISGNPQPDRDWASYPFSYLTGDETEHELNLPFTYADYKAMNQEKVEELMIVPESMLTDNLVPVHEYIGLSQQEITGKVPYIWLVDENNLMHRAALPYMWAQSCKERLDFWNFIQELGGVNSFHVKLALEREKLEWQKQSNDEIKALKARHEQELAEARANAAGEAMARLTGILLGEDQPVLKVSKPASPVKQEPAKPEVREKAESKAEKPTPKPAEKQEEAAMEPYLDTFRCTSCNDCTDKYPGIFVYNEDKQAEIRDDFKGTYEQLVIAAEACPAACIHPGDPKDPNEANLAELKQRAAKFH